MFQFFLQHQFGFAVAAYWIFSAAVSSLPDPVPAGNAGYLWLYRFCHTTAGNLTTVFGSKFSVFKIVLPLLLVPLLFSTTACAHYAIHPGTINTADSAAYDTLLIAESAIAQAKTDYQAGRLPASAKPVLNTLVSSYDVARDSWLAYRGALAANQPPDSYSQQLGKNLSDLLNAIRNFKEAQQ